MKRLMYLFVAVCMTTAASAQKLSEKDLQGTWKLISFEAGGMNIDVAAEKYTLSPEIEAQMTPELKQQMAQAMEMFKNSFAYIDGKNLRQTMGPQEQKGTFVMSEKDGKSMLTLTKEDGTTTELTVAMVDKKLRIEQMEGGASAALVYTKQ